MKKRYTPKVQMPSRVLLVCVYDTVILQITNQAIFTRFSPFGAIIKILIFEKNQVTKLFIEFSQVFEAENAKRSLDGSKLFETICKMSIYYSNFSSVDLRHQTSSGLVLENNKIVTESLENFSHAFQQLNSQVNHSNFDYFNEEILMHTFDAYPFFSRSKTDDCKLLKDYTNQVNNLESPNKSQQSEIDVQKFIEKDINWLLKSQEKASKNDQMTVSSYQQGQSKCMKIKDQGFMNNCFLMFQIQNYIPPKNIYNLFSNFGNISYIKISKGKIYIKFRSIEFAAMAKNYLNDYKLMENVLKLQTISDVSEASPREEEYSEITYFDQSYDRFTPQKSITINPPSKTLHISSIKRQICKSHTLHKIFQQFGQIEGIQILNHSNDKNMALVKYKSIEDSFYAISELHNCSISGRKIQISFTKSRL